MGWTHDFLTPLPLLRFYESPNAIFIPNVVIYCMQDLAKFKETGIETYFADPLQNIRASLATAYFCTQAFQRNLGSSSKVAIS